MVRVSISVWEVKGERGKKGEREGGAGGEREWGRGREDWESNPGWVISMTLKWAIW